MRYQVKHITKYKYSETASLSQNELFLLPRPTSCQLIEELSLEIKPEPQYLRQRLDYFGNTCNVFMVQHAHSDLQVSSKFIVSTQKSDIPDPSSTLSWEKCIARLRSPITPEDLDASQFCYASPMIDLIYGAADFARISFPNDQPVLVAALHLIERIFNEFEYDKKATTVDSSVVQVLTDKKGVCQDFAHLAISGLRSLGLAARYVSGYLETLPPPGKPKLVGADASHAWLSLYIPDLGWIDLDPTNNIIPGEQHVTLAWGRDYGDVTPVKGVVLGGGNHKLSVSVDMSVI